MRRAKWYLVLPLALSLSGCATVTGWFHKTDTVTTVADPELARLQQTERWFKAIEGVRIATAAAKAFAEAAHDVGKIDDAEYATVVKVKEMVKASLVIANSELTLYFQNASSVASVEARISEMNILGAQLGQLVSGYKARESYTPKPVTVPVEVTK